MPHHRLLLCLLAIFIGPSLSIVPAFSQENSELADESILDPANSDENKKALEAIQKKYADLPNGMVATAKFAAPQYMVTPQISPDGKHVAYQVFINDTSHLVILNTVTEEQKRLEAPDILWFRWAGNQRILTGVSGFLTVSNIYIYDLESNNYDAVGHEALSFTGSEIIYVDPKGAYFLESKQKSILESPSVYRVTIKDNIVTRLVKAQKDIWNWYADKDGVVRVGTSAFGYNIKIYYRRSNDEKFIRTQKISTKDPDDKNKQSLFAFNDIATGTDQGYVMSNQESDRFALYNYNYFTGEIGEKVFEHKRNDISNYQLNSAGDGLLSAQYTDDVDRVYWFDKGLETTQKLLEEALPGQEVWMSSFSDDKSLIIVFTTSSTDPGSYYLFKKNSKELIRLGGVNDFIEPQKMSVSKYVQYEARDGVTIYSYLTLPKGRDPKNLPLIILPHGGPYGVRDNGDYDPEVQFLVNRGYAVLQPNFRGSDSYGEDFFELGVGQIGRKMQDDLDDGMDWLVRRGIADPNRVCLVGSSYGGYAALWGAIRNPERYRCAASFAGVTDWNLQLKFDKRFFQSRHARDWRETVRGDIEFDLDTVSPTRNIEKLIRPILLTHGDGDSNVPFDQYEIMVKAAEKANVEIETHVYEGEGHGLSEEKNRIDWYNRLEAFLTQHNPAD